jgi:hypothetical protein
MPHVVLPFKGQADLTTFRFATSSMMEVAEASYVNAKIYQPDPLSAQHTFSMSSAVGQCV